jgi:hypothetical protein
MMVLWFSDVTFCSLNAYSLPYAGQRVEGST